jgi:hypothetical protein
MTSPSSPTSRSSTPSSGGPTIPGPALAVRAHGGAHQRLGHAVALDDALSAQPPDALVHGRGQCRRARHEQPRAAQRLGDRRVLLGLRGEPAVHRRHAEQHRRRAR